MQYKKILYISGINNTQRYGLYWAVYNRMKNLKNHSKNIYFVNIPIVDSTLIRFIKFIANRPINQIPLIEDSFIEVLPLQRTFFDYLMMIFKKDYFEQKLYKKILDICLKEKIDFIHIHWAYPYGYVISKISKKYDIPYVINIHGSDINIHPFRNTKIMSKTIHALNGAKTIYCVSKELSNKAKEFVGLKQQKFQITGNGVNIPNIMDVSSKKVFHICFIGSLKKVKGADRLVDIFKKISIKIPAIKLTVIGEGEYFGFIDKERKRLSLNIDMLGYQEPNTIEHIRKNCDLTIVPSRAEGFSLVVLESYAQNIPVIATNCGGMSSLVFDKELLVDDNDEYIDIFSEKIVEYYTKYYDLYMKKRNSGQYIKYVQKYNWVNIIKKEGEYYL